MKYLYLFLCFAGLLFSITTQSQENEYTNPIISGFNPDPSICRVDNDYYLVTSTFEYFPGVPIYHSTDLIHWQMIGHALQRPSQLNLDSVSCSAGIYAPTLRYHNGTYYMITTLVGSKNRSGNFIVTATNPKGPWSDPHWIEEAPGIDPSLFFDEDGKAYYSGNYTPTKKVFDKQRNIWVQEIDLKNWKLIGERVEVLNGGEYYANNKIGFVNHYESSHIYKKNGFYYLLISHGGTFHNHAVSIWRSKNVFGPYEMNPTNPILTHRDLPVNHEITSTGHADLVQTQNNEWWMVYLAKRPYNGELHILGRETFMSPLDWSGVWPVVNPKGQKGKGELQHSKPDLPQAKLKPVSNRENFNSDKLSGQWTFIRTPRSNWYSLATRKGFLRINLRKEKLSEQVNSSFIGIRQKDKCCSVTAKLDFIPRNENEEAGLVVEKDMNNYFRFTISLDKNNSVIQLYRKNGNAKQDELINKVVVTKGVKFLRITALETNYNFYYSANGKNWKLLSENTDGSFLGDALAGRFTGTFIGMYASSNGNAGTNYIDFDWFEYEKQ